MKTHKTLIKTLKAKTYIEQSETSNIDGMISLCSIKLNKYYMNLNDEV